ncbi:MAG TPA: thioesterase family protein [Beijerinckiaceae bacterium]|nr:thioesterase family protein [Beijerinckiaceae bacterium]
MEFWGAFFDTSYAYRFGPPSHDVTIATLRAPEGEPIAEAFHFSLGRAALPPPATIAASLERCPGGWRLRLKADSFASSVRIEDPAYRPHDDWFHLAPGREKIVRLTVAIRGQLSPAARDRRAAFRRIHLLREGQMSSVEKALSPLLTTPVDPAWIDYNGHMNDAYYALVFSRTGDKLLEAIGLETHGRERTSRTIYTTSLIIHYHHEVTTGDVLTTSARLLETDRKRLRIWFEMRNAEGTLVASSEQVYLCVDQSGEKPRAASFLSEQQTAIAELHAATADLPWPEAAGRGISLKRT